MKVCDIPTKPILTVLPDALVSFCVEKMNQRCVGSILVMNDKSLLGIFTERDVLHMLPIGIDRKLGLPVSDFMTCNPVTVHPSAGLQEAEMLMKTGKFRHLPVVESGQVLNVISSKDIFDALYAQDTISSFQLKIVDAIVATVCHEINNPLAIAHGKLRRIKGDENQAHIQSLGTSLLRIADVVKRLSTLDQLVLKNYCGQTKTIDLTTAIAEVASFIKAS